MKNIPYELIARYLSGTCNADEQQQVREWIREYPDVMDELSLIWQQVPSDEFTPDLEKALRKVNQRIDAKEPKRSRVRLYTLLASVAAVAAVVILILINNINVSKDVTIDPLLLTLSSGTEETLEYTLPDGSKIWLNRSSALHYPETFEGDLREVYLEGEAFFEVSPDAERPFIIHANHTLTRVVGTSFGIRAVKGADEVIVTVSTGVINFSAEGKTTPIELRQGEQGICNPEQQKLEKNHHPDPNSLAWKTKILFFKQSPLPEVARIIENIYHTTLSVDSSASDLRLTATFEQLNLQEIMQVIEMTLQVKAETNGEGIVLTAR